MEELKIKIIEIARTYHNDDISNYLKDLSDADVKVSVNMLNFLKQTYPQIADVIRGELQEETWV